MRNRFAALLCVLPLVFGGVIAAAPAAQGTSHAQVAASKQWICSKTIGGRRHEVFTQSAGYMDVLRSTGWYCTRWW